MLSSDTSFVTTDIHKKKFRFFDKFEGRKALFSHPVLSNSLSSNAQSLHFWSNLLAS
jgi:hypothetical protein